MFINHLVNDFMKLIHLLIIKQKQLFLSFELLKDYVVGMNELD